MRLLFRLTMGLPEFGGVLFCILGFMPAFNPMFHPARIIGHEICSARADPIS
jgi:hypothetical protein